MLLLVKVVGMSHSADPSKSVTKLCPGCGLPFTRLRSRPEKYCSRDCRTAKEPPMLLATICPTCEVSFSYYASWPRIYCSRPCAMRARPMVRTRYTATCEQCGKTHEVEPSSERGRFCSLRCLGDWLHIHARRGPDHPNWTGGHLEYYGPSWCAARREARLRDVVCVRCGRAPDGRALDVHHISPFRRFGVERHAEANALSNLMSLCRYCHKREEWVTIRRAIRR